MQDYRETIEVGSLTVKVHFTLDAHGAGNVTIYSKATEGETWSEAITVSATNLAYHSLTRIISCAEKIIGSAGDISDVYDRARVAISPESYKSK